MKMRLSLVALFSLMLSLVLVVPAPTILKAQQDSTPTPVVLFHDDFSTRADRWKLIDLGKAVIGYDPAPALNMEAKADNYAFWSVPDTDLKPDAFDIQVQGTWVSGGDDAQFGIVINYRSDTDMLIATVARDGTVRIGSYYFGVWNDLAKPAQTQLDDPNAPVTVRAEVSKQGSTHQVDVYVNGDKRQTITLKSFRAGSFGVFASSGASGGVKVSLNDFTVREPA